MKKYLLLLTIPFTVFASYDISPVDECEEMKTDFQAQSQAQKNALPSLLTDIIYTRSAVFSLSQKADEFRGRANGASDTDVKNAWIYAATSCQNSYDQFSPYSDSLLQDYFTISNRIYSLSASIDFINCLACSDNTSSTNSCCDFTEILQAIGNVSNAINIANYELSVISNQLNSLEYTNFLLEHGFFSVTNLLSFSNKNLLDINTNLVKTSLLNLLPLLTYEKNTYLMTLNPMFGNQMRPLLRDWSSYNRTQTAFNPSDHGLLNSIYSMDYVHYLQLSSLNNYFYDFSLNRYPILTNTVGSIQLYQTNFFSFFRGEIGVRGVLEDWTSEQVDGTYHDFLTNHYINVVRGGSLSGYQAEKTNWFARIETLLASLVFLDSSNTNSYNEAAASFSNSISRVKDDFNDKLEGVSSASSTQMELVSDIEKSMYESLQSFSKAFSSASLPSTVQLLYVHKTSGAKSLPSSDSVDVTVPVEGNLMDFIEIIRSCTTLCWVFFGLWFMFKFSVWTVKKIYMLIRYIIDFFNMVAGGK